MTGVRPAAGPARIQDDVREGVGKEGKAQLTGLHNNIITLPDPWQHSLTRVKARALGVTDHQWYDDIINRTAAAIRDWALGSR